MPVGSTYSTLKAAIVARLSARPGLAGVHISYRAPEDASEVQGPTGANESIALDDAEGEQDNVVFAGLPLYLDETYSLALKIQVLRPSSDGTQQAADTRVDELLYEVLHELANDPTFGVDEPEFEHIEVTRSGCRRFTGTLPNTDGHAARCDLDLAVEARLSFTL